MKTIHDLIGRYWDIAYKEGKTGISYGTEAQEVLSEINSFIVAKDAGPVPYLHPRPRRHRAAAAGTECAGKYDRGATAKDYHRPARKIGGVK